MFDDVKKEPEDMFDATDKVAPQVVAPTDTPIPTEPPTPRIPLDMNAAAQPSMPATPSVEARMTSVSGSRGGLPWKVILLVIGILFVIGAAFLLSMRILGAGTPQTPEPPAALQDVEEEEEEVEEAEPTPTPVPEEVVEQEEPVSRKDTDKDGLTDAEEAEYGTSARSEDTDSDGLFDLEEIRTWETDPLNPDTDGDGYLDGKEVEGGYNPNGEGVLREPPTESS